MNRIIFSTALVLAAAPSVLQAEDPLVNPNRFSFGATIGLNFKASFRRSTVPFSVANPGPAAGGADHAYDDGYVRLDSSNDAGGTTWNWGYQNATQVTGDTVQYHASSPNPAFAGYGKNVTDDPQYGLELVYQRVLGNLFSSGHWGLEAGFGYTDLDLANASSGPGAILVTTDAYPLNGVLPPGAGYAGTFSGPGALLGDMPARSTATAALISRDKLTGQLFNLRLGPFAEWNLTPKLSLAVSAGLALTPACIDYDFTETVLLPTGSSMVTSGHSSRGELLYGLFASGTLRYDFTERWGVYAGGRFQSLNDLDQSVAGRTARLDQGATIYGTIGVSWRF
ncbi:MAG TPA: hypothetical protein VMB21_03950 [Candidatus Limnocylindria bacterium]|nr:hypothetical protein [Candidatus Limnocylindria bacterium]